MKNSLVNKLLIGSANFGMDYGIAFSRRVSREEVFNILDFAKEKGVFGIDTAPAYGDAERIIGEYLKLRGNVFHIITKLPMATYKNYIEVKSVLINSLKRLEVDKVDYFLVHSFKTFAEQKDIIIESLELLKEEGFIEKYGISVYHPVEVLEFLKVAGGNFAVELPLNIFDRRFMPYLKDWKRLNLTLFARSVFLQGLFFLPEEKLTGVFEKVREKVLRLRALAQELGISLPCLCLSFVASLEELDGFIVGVDSLEQLRDTISCLENFKKLEVSLDAFEEGDEDIIIPYRWSKDVAV